MRSLKIVALLVVAGVATTLAAEKPLAEPDGRDEWAKADTAVATLMKEADAAARSAVFASALLRKYLPGYRVYVRMADSYGKETRIFLATRDGAVTPLPDAQWRKRDDEPFWRSPVISEFLRKRQIKVRNGEEAVELARLFEELEAAANYVAFLKINTKDFTVFDSQFIEQQFGPRVHWQYTPEPRGGEGWTVTVKYVGPPASIRQPPVYEIDLDEQQTFQDLRWKS